MFVGSPSFSRQPYLFHPQLSIIFLFLRGSTRFIPDAAEYRVHSTGSGAKLFLGHRFPLAYARPPLLFLRYFSVFPSSLFTLQNLSSFVLSYGHGIPHVPNYNNPPRHESGRVMLSPPFHTVPPSHLKLGRAGVPPATTLRRLQLMQIFTPKPPARRPSA